MFVLHTSTPEETQAVASALADLAQPGDLLVLSGDLGAGKTTFTQGYARALGVVEAVTSPTFVLHRAYRGRLDLHHLDVYRLGGPDDAEDLDLAGLLEGDAVTLVEWGETIGGALPPERLTVHLTLGAGDDDRTLRVEPVGAAWSSRAGLLGGALAPWAVGARQEAAARC